MFHCNQHLKDQFFLQLKKWVLQPSSHVQKILLLCNIEAHSHNNCCHGRAIIITYSKCVFVALVTQHVENMHHIILSYVACLSLPYFPMLCHKWHSFQKELLNIVCLFWFLLQLLSETFLMLKRIQWDTIINVHRPPSCKVSTILVRF
jgi:hypothetical protein